MSREASSLITAIIIAISGIIFFAVMFYIAFF